MLEETKVVSRFSTSSFVVGPRRQTFFTFSVTPPTGALLTGTFEIEGAGRDLNVMLTDINGTAIRNFGRQIGEGRINEHLPRGQYRLSFDNGFSIFSAKSVIPDLGVEFYK